MTIKRRQWLDIGERAVWTLLQAGVAEGVVVALEIPQPWVVPIAAALAAVKSALATRFGDGTAATLPATGGRHAVVEGEGQDG